jgi:phasin family protein
MSDTPQDQPGSTEQVVAAKAEEPAAAVAPVPAPAATATRAGPKPARAKPAAKAVPLARPAVRAKKTIAETPANKQSKEPTPMTTTPDFTASISEAMTEMQSRAKVAYDKSTTMATELGEFTKGNMEALVESGKIVSSAVQDMGKSLVEEVKSAFEIATADMKEMAAIKSPTDLFQLQSKLARRNFDSMMAMSSKASESMVKLSSEAVSPLSSRMSVAAEIVSKAA